MIEDNKRENKIHEIANILYLFCSNNTNNGLMAGKSGISIFLYEYGKHYSNPKYLDLAARTIEEATAALEKEELKYTFCDGIAGMLWTINYFDNVGLIELEDVVFDEIDKFLCKVAIFYFENDNYDYLHGGIGLGVYFLNKPQKNKRILTKMVDYLAKMAIQTLKGVAWVHIDYQGNKNYNLGLSHGMASIAWFLANCYANKISVRKCEKLLNGLIDFYQNNQIQNTFYTFPSQIAISNLENKDIIPSRLAWCYGDLGIALAFWQVGKALKREDWKQEALEIFSHCSKRRNLQQNGVKDAGLCHGTAGIAHIFSRIYRETKNPIFKESANYWIDETLKMATFEDGLASFKTWRGEETEWINDYGFLEGIAGIGLALLSHLSNEEPTWDKCLLMS